MSGLVAAYHLEEETVKHPNRISWAPDMVSVQFASHSRRPINKRKERRAKIGKLAETKLESKREEKSLPKIHLDSFGNSGKTADKFLLKLEKKFSTKFEKFHI